MNKRCAATYRGAIWGIEHAIMYACTFPVGHPGPHHGEDAETGTYLNWWDEPVSHEAGCPCSFCLSRRFTRGT
jgi:hypothetical protein